MVQTRSALMKADLDNKHGEGRRYITTKEGGAKEASKMTKAKKGMPKEADKVIGKGKDDKKRRRGSKVKKEPANEGGAKKSSQMTKKGTLNDLVKAVGNGKLPFSKKTKKGTETYRIYIYKVLKQVHPDLGISYEAMSIINSSINDIFEKVAQRAAHVAQYFKKSTINPHDIEIALQFILPTELVPMAILKGRSAITKFMSA